MDFHILPYANAQPKEKITLLHIFSFRCNVTLRLIHASETNPNGRKTHRQPSFASNR